MGGSEGNFGFIVLEINTTKYSEWILVGTVFTRKILFVNSKVSLGERKNSVPE